MPFFNCFCSTRTKDTIGTYTQDGNCLLNGTNTLTTTGGATINGGEIAGRHERFAFLQAQGLGVMFVSYRGYGASTGTISEQGLVTDALAAYDVLRAKGVAADSIMLLGESLGTGVAIQLAA